jgi:hypothetical protein
MEGERCCFHGVDGDEFQFIETRDLFQESCSTRKTYILHWPFPDQNNCASERLKRGIDAC